MRKLRYTLLAALAGAALTASAATDYMEGVLVLNEDSYMLGRSSMNHFNPEDGAWEYRVFQANNPGYSFGQTAEYAAVWNGRLYVVAKQPGTDDASFKSGVLTVADASTLKMEAIVNELSDDRCDGRSFLGLTAKKGYVSSSNGVWVLDLESNAVTGRVAGTDDDATESLYRGQCGMMVKAAGRVFVAHQSRGLLVVDPEADAVEATVTFDEVPHESDALPAIGSVVVARDGMLYCSVAASDEPTGAALNYLLRVNPETLATEVIDLGALGGLYGPANSWYAWTPDTFCASATDDYLFWTGGETSWFTGGRIFRYDLAANRVDCIVNLEDGEWTVYGCSLRVDPLDGTIYTSVQREWTDFALRRYTAAGELVAENAMEGQYWFPSIPVFPLDPANSPAGLETLRAESVATGAADGWYDLGGRRLQCEPEAGLYIRVADGRAVKICR